MLRRICFIRGLWLMVVLWGAGAWAQGNSVITGTLTNTLDKKPLVDVVVTATSPQLQGERTVLSDKSGLYRIPQLPPGTYTLRFEAQGYQPYARDGILLRIDRTIRFNAELAPDSLSSDVEVVGSPPTLDVGSSAAGVTVDQDFIRNIAVIRPGTKGSASRSFEGLAELAPGATEDRYGVSISGSSSPESQYVVDGLSVNDPGVGTLGTPLSVEFVKEVNIITGGYMPEYGRSTGGVLNVVTKSGSNEFHGSVFANYAPGAFQTSGKEILREGSVISAQGSAHNLGDFGFDLGGPLLKDKLWFYVGVAPSFNRIQVDRQLSSYELCSEVDLENGCSAVGARRKDPTTGFSQVNPIEGSRTSRFADERSVQYLGKLTYNFNPDHSLSVSAFGTPRSSGGSGKYSFSDDGEPEVCTSLSCTAFVQGAYEAIATRRSNSAMDIVAKQASSFFDKKLLVDATLGWHHQADSILPSDGSGLGSGEGLSAKSNIAWRRTRNPGFHTINEFETLPYADACGTTPEEQRLRCPVAAYSTGGPGTISIQRLDRVQGKVMGTYLLEALGHHILKAGADIERMSFYNKRARTGLTPWQECTGGDCFFSLNQYGYLQGPDIPVFLPNKEGTSTSTTVGGFLQDSWSVMDKVTVNVGLRYDVQTIYGLDGEVGLHLPNQWSPRLGVIYDPTQSGRAKLFANYARFFENVPLDMADLSFPQQQLLSATYDSPPCVPSREDSLLGDCTQNVNRQPIGNRESPNQLWDAQGGDRVPVDPQIRAQSADEFVLGGEYELFTASRLGATYTRRYLNDVIEDMSRDDGSTFFLGNPGKGYSTDFPLARREYDAVNLYFQRAFTNGWLAQGSYTWSTLRGNYSGLFRADTGQLSPNLTRDFDLVSLTVNREGQLPGDRTHSFKVFAAKELVLGPSTSINVGGNYRARSGAPLNYLGAHPRRSGSETFILPRGSAGRLPWVHGVDGHVGLNQRLVKDYVLTVSLDVFNLFNFQQYTDVDQTFTTTRVYAIEQGGKPDDLTACLTQDNPNCKVISTATNKPIGEADINPNFKRPTAYQAPRSIRLGAKLSF
ncbi:TonB-dependent receptor [Corallococcus exiguus]|uniref:TonB-dependent receptor n=2 Tax=Corallococcus exiguus TaxID=83462 RepID=A0A7X4Y5G5_9BACT|nr:TonB-dependent receptor [Corallococcus exiguus]NBC38936.1 TonB-dependent receptor [Corallococcus exiguus]TNV60258.1 TonB-dependent receptor [Corallococcus exiguus]